MPIPLPNLDDRRWADLVEEGQALIPLYARETWTDHNAHDPGITLMELFAWIAEMDIYQLNRIPDRHKRKFLALVGITSEPPQPARTVLSFRLKDGATGGAMAEQLAHAIGRAIDLMETPQRAIALRDHEILARSTLGCI
jgi:hypothetical protein